MPLVTGKWPLPQSLLPTHEGALKAPKQSDLSWRGDVQLPGIDGSQEPPQSLGGLAEGRSGFGAVSNHQIIMRPMRVERAATALGAVIGRVERADSSRGRSRHPSICRSSLSRVLRASPLGAGAVEEVVVELLTTCLPLLSWRRPAVVGGWDETRCW